MNYCRVTLVKHRSFFSSSVVSSSLPWISPLQFVKGIPPQLDPPPDSPNNLAVTRRKSKYIDHDTAVMLIKRERDPQRALEIFNMVAEQRGFYHNHATYSTLLHKLAHAKKFQAIDALLHQMTCETCKFHENIFLDLMKHYSKSSLHQRVLELFYAIEHIACEKPSLKAVSTCLNLLVCSQQVNLVTSFLLHCKTCLKLKPNTCVFNIIVKYHCRRGDLGAAFDVLEEMKKSDVSYPNLITFSTLMDGLCKVERFKEAIQLLEEMLSKHQMTPDALAYNVLIDGFCLAGKVDKALKVLEFMKRCGTSPNLVNYSTVMKGFGKEGKLEEVNKVFGEIKSSGMTPDSVCYTTLIDCMCRIGKTDEAMDLLMEMKEIKCSADIVTFNVLLGGFCREGRFEEALGMVNRLPHEGVCLNKCSYRIVLNSLCKNGELEKATHLLDVMLRRGFVPHHATSNELLINLCNSGMADDAVTAVFGLMESGFKPDPDAWAVVIEIICRERKLLFAFELLDELITEESGNSPLSDSCDSMKCHPWQKCGL